MELDELERELTGEMIALEKQLAVVDAELAKLPENQEKVLRLRYIEGLKWDRIAEMVNYMRDTVGLYQRERENNQKVMNFDEHASFTQFY